MNFTIKWINKSKSTQDWMIYQTDNFTLDPQTERVADISINHSYAYQLAVTTDGGFAACNLNYDATSNKWSLSSKTPMEWQFVPPSGSEGVIVLSCLLENVDQYHILEAIAPVEELPKAKI